jgi:hypothetical protein
MAAELRHAQIYRAYEQIKAYIARQLRAKAVSGVRRLSGFEFGVSWEATRRMTRAHASVSSRQFWHKTA